MTYTSAKIDTDYYFRGQCHRTLPQILLAPLSINVTVAWLRYCVAVFTSTSSARDLCMFYTVPLLFRMVIIKVEFWISQVHASALF